MTRPRRIRIRLTAPIAVAVLLAGWSLPAAASPRLADARQRAATLRIAVDRLQVAAASATEDYDAAQAALGDVVTAHLLAERQLDALRSRSAASDAAIEDKIRSLYMSGGRAGLLDSVLGAHDLGDAVARLHTVKAIVQDGQVVAAESGAATDQAAGIESRLSALAAGRTRLEQQAAAAAEKIRTALAAQQRLLAAANADIRRIAEQERQAAAAAAAAAFQAQLAAARAASDSVTGLGPGAEPSAVAARAVVAARAQLGKPYVWGATGPAAFDCSGLTGYAYRQAGLSLPRTSREQWYAGRQIGLADLAAGDLLFWATDTADPATIHHVAIYIGGGLMIAAPQPGENVTIQSVYLTGYVGAVRPVG